MADLIAEGESSQHRWRRALPADRLIILGRAVSSWSVPWDEQISRRHAELRWRRGRLAVKRLDTARNPIFYRGHEESRFEIRPGEHFVVGQTTFTLTDEEVNISLDAPQPVQEQSFTSQYLERVRFRNADQRIDVLARLPDVISGASSDTELFVRLTNLLLAGIPRASAVALVAVDSDSADARATILHWDRRLATTGEFQPSQRLIQDAVRRQQSVLHVWGADVTQSSSAVTVSENFDWAFCTPLLGTGSDGWGIYVTGSFVSELPSTPTPSDPKDLREELKFTELVAAILSSLREVRELQKRQASLSQFFAPQVLEALGDESEDAALVPRETEVTVLFCDLRGFSLESEKSAHDLLGLLERVSGALGVMTHYILEQGGVVGDFQGDAAMGFWGWPLPQEDAVERACYAALSIRREFESAARRSGDPLADFRMGIGIATGQAVAGKIGTVDQVKVTVFGPVVNLASRLEGMTKILRASILLDEATADVVRQKIDPSEGRCRRLAIVKPYGLDNPLEVAELLPSVEVDPLLSDEHLADYESALDAFLKGDWSNANALLHRVPAEDRGKDFLAVFIAQNNRTPPQGWNGVIPLGSKQ